MNDAIVVGLYQYKSKVNNFSSLPNQLQKETLSSGAALLELFMGKIEIYDLTDHLLINQKENYTLLPSSIIDHHKLNDFSTVFGGIDITNEEIIKGIDIFFRNDRRNNNIYNHVLYEISQYFLSVQRSSSEAFIHLYRTLEYISFSFPMIFASTSTNYYGSYSDLKRYFSNDGGELKFYSKFFENLFGDDKLTYNYIFNVLVDVNCASDLKRALNYCVDFEDISFTECRMEFKFKNIIDIIVEIRNRYFHMLYGLGRNNFFGMDYDLNDFLSKINPIIVNWFALVYSNLLNKRMINEIWNTI